MSLFTSAYTRVEIDEGLRRTYEVFAGDNVLINSAFQVNQRNVSGTVVLAAGAYGHDGWKAGAAGCTYTFETSGGVTTLTISAGSLIQIVEGINLETDTYCLSWNGTVQGKIGAGSFGAPGITGAVTGGTNLSVEFETGTLSKPKLEPGTAATPYRSPKIGEQLALCQRYFQTVPPFSAFAGYTSNSSDTTVQFRIPLFRPMRANPSINLAASDFRVSAAGRWLTPSARGTIDVNGKGSATVATGIGVSQSCAVLTASELQISADL